MERQRIYAQKTSSLNENERLEVARLLIKAGYAVKIKKEKKDGRSAINYVVEFWTEEAT